MFQFNELKINDVGELREFFDAQSFGMCDYSVGTVFMWKDYYQTKYCVHNGFLIIRYRHAENEICYSFPVTKSSGDEEALRETLRLLREHALGESGKFILVNVPKEMLGLLDSAFDVDLASAERDWADYIYNYEDLAEMKGRRFSGKRNHIHNFIKNYPGYEVREITRRDIPHIKEEYIKYFLENIRRDDQDEYKLAESEETIVALDAMFDLGMSGVFVEVAGHVAAFAIGEVVGDTVMAHVEKARTEYNGIYSFVCREFVRASYIDNIRYVNREEDVGSEGLRKSKLSYSPAFLLDKYKVEIR